MPAIWRSSSSRRRRVRWIPTKAGSAPSFSASAVAVLGAASTSSAVHAGKTTGSIQLGAVGRATALKKSTATAVLVAGFTFSGVQLPNGYYYTNFPNTESPISESGLWVNGARDGVDFNDVNTTTNKAFGTQTGNDTTTTIGVAPNRYGDSTAILKGTWSPDQWVKSKIFTTVNNANYAAEVEHRLRSVITAHTNRGYECEWSANANGTRQYLDIVRWNGSVADFTPLVHLDGVFAHDGDELLSVIQGHTITMYINGVQVLQATDTTWADGNPGMGFYLNNQGTVGDPTTFGFVDFEASNFATVGNEGIIGRSTGRKQSTTIATMVVGTSATDTAHKASLSASRANSGFSEVATATKKSSSTAAADTGVSSALTAAKASGSTTRANLGWIGQALVGPPAFAATAVINFGMAAIATAQKASTATARANFGAFVQAVVQPVVFSASAIANLGVSATAASAKQSLASIVADVGGIGRSTATAARTGVSRAVTGAVGLAAGKRASLGQSRVNFGIIGITTSTTPPTSVVVILPENWREQESDLTLAVVVVWPPSGSPELED